MRSIYEGDDTLPLYEFTTMQARTVRNLRLHFNELVVQKFVTEMVIKGQCGSAPATVVT